MKKVLFALLLMSCQNSERVYTEGEKERIQQLKDSLEKEVNRSVDSEMKASDKTSVSKNATN